MLNSSAINDLPENPLDIAEEILSSREVPFERASDEDLAAEYSGNWCDVRVWFSWREELGALIITCSLDGKVPERAAERVYPLLAKVNEMLVLGHFDFMSEGRYVCFRHTTLVRGDEKSTLAQIEDTLDLALSECDRLYPALQSVLWSGKSADEALQMAIFETVGEA
jgi:hypothetical protein